MVVQKLCVGSEHVPLAFQEEAGDDATVCMLSSSRQGISAREVGVIKLRGEMQV
jgi:hypothetical protein